MSEILILPVTPAQTASRHANAVSWTVGMSDLLFQQVWNSRMHPVHQSVWPQPTQDAESACRCIANALDGLCIVKERHHHAGVPMCKALPLQEPQRQCTKNAQHKKSSDAVTCVTTVAAVRAGGPLVLSCLKH